MSKFMTDWLKLDGWSDDDIKKYYERKHPRSLSESLQSVTGMNKRELRKLYKRNRIVRNLLDEN